MNASTGPDDPMAGITSTDPKSFSPYSSVVPTSNSSTSTLLPPHSPFDQQPQLEYDTATAMMPDMVTESEPEFAGFIPELAMQMPFDPEGFFSIGNMFEHGFFNFPMDESNNAFFVP